MTKQNYLTKAPFSAAPYKERIDELMSKMTVAEKVGQLNLESCDDSEELAEWNMGHPVNPGEITERVRRGAVGSMLTRGVEKANNIQRIAVEESRLGIPLLFGYDVIHGHKTIFPIPLGEAATWEPELLTKAEEWAAREAYADGINWAFAPMIDLCREARWGRIAEGAGEDPLLGSLIAQAKVKGMQVKDPDTGRPYVAACFKHYCGYGLSEAGRDYEECNISERTLHMDYMKPYRAAVDAGAMSAMSAFNVLNGEPITASRRYLTDILRGKYGFEGFVVSDYDAVDELRYHRVAADRKEAAALAVTAGVDMDMASNTFLENCEALYHEDKRFADAIDEAVRRILAVKFALGLFENPYFKDVPGFTYAPEAAELAREVARRSIVLLENKNDTLPLKKDKKYFLTGELADTAYDMIGTWATKHPGSQIYTVKRAMEEGGFSFVYHPGCPTNACLSGIDNGGEYYGEYDEHSFDEALELADGCDAVIFVCGEYAAWSGENAARVRLTLPDSQQAYLRALKAAGHTVITVIMCGRPIACPEIKRLADGALVVWHGGSEGGRAICDCLFGDFNPSGRLPVTFPYHSGQVPYYHSILSSGRPRERFKRYRDCRSTPLYPFGYGLSYSEISYGKVYIENSTISAFDTLEVHVELENRSDRDATETVQAYFRDVVSSVATPDKKLCGFVKADVPANSSVEVTLEIPAERFALMTTELCEVTEPGEFLLFVGRDSTCSDAVSFTVK